MNSYLPKLTLITLLTVLLSPLTNTQSLADAKSDIQEYDQAIKLNPQDATAFNNRGLAYDELGQTERAIQDYDQAIKLNPQDAKAFDNRGLSYDDLGQHQRAIQDYDQAIKLNPQDAKAFDNRGRSYVSVRFFTWLKPKQQNGLMIALNGDLQRENCQE